MLGKGNHRQTKASAKVVTSRGTPDIPTLYIEGITLKRMRGSVTDAEVESALQRRAHECGGTDARVDEGLAEALGFESLDALRQSQKVKLEHESAELTDIDLKRQLFDQLLERHNFSVPQSMIELELLNVLAESELESDQEFSSNLLPTAEEGERNKYRAVAEQRVRLKIILTLIGRKLGIKVDVEEIKAMLAKAGREHREDAQAWSQAWTKRLDEDPSALSQLHWLLYKDRVARFLIDSSEITDTTIFRNALQGWTYTDFGQNDNLADRNDAARLKLLDSAALPEAPAEPIRRFEYDIFTDAVDILGGASLIGLPVLTPEGILSAVMLGFPSQVLNALNDVGWSHEDMERVIAPRRTLMRRKSEKSRLKREESDAAWRLAHTLALAAYVLNGKDNALVWLKRSKASMLGLSPLDLLSTSVGTNHVHGVLRSLDWGDVA